MSEPLKPDEVLSPGESGGLRKKPRRRITRNFEVRYNPENGTWGGGVHQEKLHRAVETHLAGEVPHHLNSHQFANHIEGRSLEKPQDSYINTVSGELPKRKELPGHE